MTSHDLSWMQAQERTRSLAASRRLEVEHLALARAAGRIVASDIARTAAGSHVSGEAMVALESGQVLTPARLALVASLGLATLPVSRRPSVAVYTVGDDLVAPGMPLPVGHRFDSTRELLMGLLRSDGLEPTAWPRLPDDPVQLEIAVRDAACAFDLVIVCGDNTVCDPSPLAALIGRFGRLEFGSIKSDSNCSAVLGSVDQALVLGMPFAPAAALSSWMTLGRALIDGMQGRREARRRWFGRLVSPLPASSTFVPVRLDHDNGSLSVQPLVGVPSLDILAMSDGLAVLPDASPRTAGDIVEVMPHGG